MSESSDSTPSSSTGAFVLRASSAVFSQRSADIFGGLLALENAHKLVTKETKAERQLIKKMAWRETKPAVEALETEKDKVINIYLFECSLFLRLSSANCGDSATRLAVHT